jgi:hypothetical protein
MNNFLRNLAKYLNEQCILYCQAQYHFLKPFHGTIYVCKRQQQGYDVASFARITLEASNLILENNYTQMIVFLDDPNCSIVEQVFSCLQQLTR